MAVRCGRCQCYHEDSKSVRECYNGGRVAVLDVPNASTGADRVTDKQWKFLNDLRVQSGKNALGDEVRARLTKRTISEAINDEKLDVAAAKADGTWVNPNPDAAGTPVAGQAEYRGPLQRADYGHLVDGWYAVASLTGNNDLDFFKIDIPTEGNWLGCLFVKRVIGGGEGSNPRTERVPRTTALKWLELVSDGTLAIDAQARYGQNIGRCGICNRALTDEASRARGIGPDCYARMS
jgi:hypothetical protein